MPNHNPFDLPGERPTPPLPPRKKRAPVPPPVLDLPPEDLHEAREAGASQERDVEPAFDIYGFTGMDVVATIEKKDARKGKPKNRNQDNIIADPGTGLLGVFDGLGGPPNGDLASKIAENVLPELYSEALRAVAKKPPGDIVRDIVALQFERLDLADDRLIATKRELVIMAEQIATHDPAMARKALALIRAFQAASEDVSSTRGDTTACVGFIHVTKDGSRYAVVANTGDSAAFVRRADGSVKRLTEEDSYLNALRASGQLSDAMLKRMKKNPNRKFPLRTPNGTEYYSYPDLQAKMVATLGSTDSIPSLAVEQLQPGDEVFFMTDGVVDKFDDPATDETDLGKLAAATRNGETLKQRTNNLRRAAKILKTYKHDDDIAIVVARMLNGT